MLILGIIIGILLWQTVCFVAYHIISDDDKFDDLCNGVWTPITYIFAHSLFKIFNKIKAQKYCCINFSSREAGRAAFGTWVIKKEDLSKFYSPKDNTQYYVYELRYNANEVAEFMHFCPSHIVTDFTQDYSNTGITKDFLKNFLKNP